MMVGQRGESTSGGEKNGRPPEGGRPYNILLVTPGLEEQHQADGWRERLVRRRRGDLILGPVVVQLGDYLERLGSLVVDAARDQGVLGPEGGGRRLLGA